MPASQVRKKFLAGKLHSGSKKGPVVTDPAQARAIQISEARAEGHNIPYPEEKGGGKKRGRKKGGKRSSK